MSTSNSSITIEQLLDFNQGPLYPKIAKIQESYVGDSDTSLQSFLEDSKDMYDPSTFAIDNISHRLILAQGSTIPGKIENAESADEAKKLVNSLNIYESLSEHYSWNGSTNKDLKIIDESYRTSHIKNVNSSTGIMQSEKNKGLLTLDNDGNIGKLDPVDNNTDKYVLGIENESVTWVNSNDFAGAHVYDVTQDPGVINSSTNEVNNDILSERVYYILGKNDKDESNPNIYGNFPKDNYAGGSPYFKGTNIYQTSDENLKTFVSDIDVNLDDISSIKKGAFFWNNDESKHLNIGVTAQSVEKLFPEIVTETDGIKAVSYSKLGVIALAAIDKLYTRVKELEKEIEILKSK